MIPKAPTTPLSTVFAAFAGDFLSTLKEEELHAPMDQSVSIPFSHSKSDGAWTDLDAESASTNISIEGTQTPPSLLVKAQHSDVPEVMPTFETLPPPEELFRKPPYHLIMRHISLNQEIILQCSHEPTLKLITAYLKRWYRNGTSHGSQKVSRRLSSVSTFRLQDTFPLSSY